MIMTWTAFLTAALAHPGFVENSGQFPPAARFAARGDVDTWVVDDGFVSVLGDASRARGVAVWFSFEGDWTASVPMGVARLPGVENYVIGDDPTRWTVGAHRYARVVRPDIVSGVDLVLRHDGRVMEYDLALTRAELASDVVVRVRGADELRLTEDGALEILTELGTLRHTPPVTYTVGADGTRTVAASRFRLLGSDCFGFACEAPTGRPVTLDPKVLYLSFLGGSSSDDYIEDLDVADDGRIVVCGSTRSLDFPVTPGGFAMSPTQNAFITVLNPNGTDAVFSTYFGGTAGAIAGGVRFAPAAGGGPDDLVLVGATLSADLPVTPGAMQMTLAGSSDHYLARFDETGGLRASTYLGGSADEAYDVPPRVAIGPLGRVFVVGQTSSADFPVTAGAFDTTLSGSDVYFARFKKDGSLNRATLLGGDGNEEAAGIAVDPTSGDVIVIGRTSSSNFPSFSDAANPNWNGPDGAFIARLKSNASQLIRATMVLGGMTNLYPQHISIAQNGDVLVAVARIGCPGVSYECFPTAYAERYSGSLKKLEWSQPFGTGVRYRMIELASGDLLLSGWSKAGNTFKAFLQRLDAAGQLVETISTSGLVQTVPPPRMFATQGPGDEIAVAGWGGQVAPHVTSLAYDSTSYSYEGFVGRLDLAEDDGFTKIGVPCGAAEISLEGFGSTTPGFPVELRLYAAAPLPAARLLLIGTTQSGGSGSCGPSLMPLVSLVPVPTADPTVISVVLPPSLPTATLLAQVAWQNGASSGFTNVLSLSVP